MRAEVCGEGFSGPDVLNVPAGTKTFYPLTFHPAAPYTVTVISLYICHSLLSLEFVCEYFTQHQRSQESTPEISSH